jgi:hypothetical protein
VNVARHPASAPASSRVAARGRPRHARVRARAGEDGHRCAARVCARSVQRQTDDGAWGLLAGCAGQGSDCERRPVDARRPSSRRRGEVAGEPPARIPSAAHHGACSRPVHTANGEPSPSAADAWAGEGRVPAAGARPGSDAQTGSPSGAAPAPGTERRPAAARSSRRGARPRSPSQRRPYVGWRGIALSPKLKSKRIGFQPANGGDRGRR